MPFSLLKAEVGPKTIRSLEPFLRAKTRCQSEGGAVDPDFGAAVQPLQSIIGVVEVATGDSDTMPGQQAGDGVLLQLLSLGRQRLDDSFGQLVRVGFGGPGKRDRAIFIRLLAGRRQRLLGAGKDEEVMRMRVADTAAFRKMGIDSHVHAKLAGELSFAFQERAVRRDADDVCRSQLPVQATAGIAGRHIDVAVGSARRDVAPRAVGETAVVDQASDHRDLLAASFWCPECHRSYLWPFVSAEHL